MSVQESSLSSMRWMARAMIFAQRWSCDSNHFEAPRRASITGSENSSTSILRSTLALRRPNVSGWSSASPH